MSLTMALMASQLPAFPADWQFTPVAKSSTQLIWQVTHTNALNLDALPSDECRQHQQLEFVWLCATRDALWSLTFQQQSWWLTKNLSNTSGEAVFLGLRGDLMFDYEDNSFRFQTFRFGHPLRHVIAAIRLRQAGYLMRVAEVSEGSVQISLRKPERYLQLQSMSSETLMLVLEVK
ncbi:hypothetical protein SAMN06297229_0958 [Pseudidiomarina planktonica]|uniref:Uncharacterized protein n=1 Tax=Pseudidiomarina planktonica TaxID=1323738 RepID=A0A1Y6ET03_9GAMM|nr:hypothetical protein [Pseudidiomarina planktonica]RUO65616.1 hypothetical protein CWI77_03965 [Pseudidiomarina planktonica]SMQ64080.1 hypothetical protein SAMN06297229_0958 [Pseudidiomarina planktonica]